MAQKVFIIPKNLIDDEEESENTYRITTLKCLKTGNPVKYIFDEKKYQLHEILQFQNPKNSWFIDDSVEQDGVIYVTTTVDPLFLILPYLKEVYSPLDQLFVDESFPDYKILSQCCLSLIDLITDKKEFGDETLYKYSEVKTIQWLKLKFENLVSLLEEKEIECSNGSKVAGLILKNKSQQIERIRKCAYEIICQYLDDKYCQKLSEALNISFEVADSGSPSKCERKKAKMSDSQEPLENYFDQFNYSNAKTNKTTKLTASQKKLLKVDKRGMKNISNFFGKKS